MSTVSTRTTLSNFIRTNEVVIENAKFYIIFSLTCDICYSQQKKVASAREATFQNSDLLAIY